MFALNKRCNNFQSLLCANYRTRTCYTTCNFCIYPPFLALQVHYVRSRRAECNTRGGGYWVGNLINGRTSEGPIIRLSPSSLSHFCSQHLSANILSISLCSVPLSLSVHYLRSALMYSPLLARGPHRRTMAVH